MTHNPADFFVISSVELLEGRQSLLKYQCNNPDFNFTEFGSCPFSWKEYGASCYQFNMPAKDFKSATVECQRSGGELVSIDSNVEQGFMNIQVKYESWIGKSSYLRVAL